ncbi:4'-phosphopantetheinyl transferase family protein [Rathayibacter iranicus]
MDHIRRAVPERFNEFCTVRALVRQGLGDLGLPRPPMVPGERGEPRWPLGVVGSITHCVGYRAVAIGRGREVRAVGIDAEPNLPLPGNVYQRISSDDERAAADRVRAVHPDISSDRLLFSAKEAVYKAWFPLARTLLDFEGGQMILSPAGFFTAVIWPSAPRREPVCVAPDRLLGCNRCTERRAGESTRWRIRRGGSLSRAGSTTCSATISCVTIRTRKENHGDINERRST